MKSDEQARVLRGFLRDLERAEKPHAAMVRRYKACDETYDAVIQPLDDKWRSNLAPPYALQITETLLAGLVDDDPAVRVDPLLPGERMRSAASSLERLIGWQREQDSWSRKVGMFIQQALIRGTSPAKVSWLYERRECEYRTFQPKVLGGFDETTEKRFETTSRPSFEPWDANDFLPDPAATSVEDAEYVILRTYETMSSLRRMEQIGVYQRVDDVVADQTRLAEAPGGREMFDRVEVLERWRRDRLTTIANRSVVLRDEPNPFHFGEIPVVCASTMPQLFALHGKSEVEIIADLQAQLWRLQNQRLDNTEFINNAALILQDGEEDVDQIFPGARVYLKNPGGHSFWSPPTHILEAAIRAEEVIKGDLQTITPANAYMSGADGGQIDQKTATGISLIQNMAQRRVIRKKRLVHFETERAGQMMVWLNQQLLPQTVAVPPSARDALSEWLFVAPDSIQGRFAFRVEDVEESLNKQERRSEALNKAGFFLANLPAWQVAGMDVGHLVRAVAEDVAEAFGEDPAKYVQQAAPVLPAGVGVGPGSAALGSPSASLPTTSPVGGAGGGAQNGVAA